MEHAPEEAWEVTPLSSMLALLHQQTGRAGLGTRGEGQQGHGEEGQGVGRQQLALMEQAGVLCREGEVWVLMVQV